MISEQPIETKKVQLSQNDCQIDAYLAQPTQPGSYPGIVVLQEIFGVNVHIRDVTERIAKLGYVAIAPALFQRQAPGFETGYTPEDIQIGKKYAWGETKAPELISDIQVAINYLKTLPNVKKSFGCIGFCFGGHVAYLAATIPDIQATASFYGAGITTRTPGDGDPTIKLTPEISGTIYTFFGMDDASIPQEQVDEIEAEFKKHNISYQLFRYDGSNHGFFCDRRGSYNPKAAADAWEKVQQLFSQVL